MQASLAQLNHIMEELKARILRLTVFIFIAVMCLTFYGCKTKNHVITEWDGDREIRWYSAEEPDSPQIDINEWYKEDTTKNKKQ